MNISLSAGYPDSLGRVSVENLERRPIHVRPHRIGAR